MGLPEPGSPTDSSLLHLSNRYGTSLWWLMTAFLPIQSSVGMSAYASGQ